MKLATSASPPGAAPCLQRHRQGKGGTLIAEEVTSLEAHRARLSSPDGYRRPCARCGSDAMHVHDYRFRRLVAFEASGGVRATPVIDVVRYRCARPECGAIWQILPALVACHLWRAWTTVERATLENTPPPGDVPERTRARWWSRLGSSATRLVQLLATETGSVLEALAQRLGFFATRGDLVLACAAQTDAAPGLRLASAAALVHRLARGLRLM
jgi:hypothetical protein